MILCDMQTERVFERPSVISTLTHTPHDDNINAEIVVIIGIIVPTISGGRQLFVLLLLLVHKCNEIDNSVYEIPLFATIVAKCDYVCRATSSLKRTCWRRKSL